MVFARIRDHANMYTAIFFASTSRDKKKKKALRVASSLESTDARAASTSKIFGTENTINILTFLKLSIGR